MVKCLRQRRAGWVLVLVAMIMTACGDAKPADTSGCVDGQYSDQRGCINGVVGHGEDHGAEDEHAEEAAHSEDAVEHAEETEHEVEAAEAHAEETPAVESLPTEIAEVPTEPVIEPTGEPVEATPAPTEEIVEATALPTEFVEPTEAVVEVVATSEVVETALPTEPNPVAAVEPHEGRLLAALSQNRGTTIFAGLIAAAGLAETLNSEEEYTVFAPMNLVFNDLPDGTVDALLADPQQLAAILGYHIVPGIIRTQDLTDGQTLTTITGEELTVHIHDNRVYINDAMVLISNNSLDNGVFHTMNQLLLPPDVTLPE